MKSWTDAFERTLETRTGIQLSPSIRDRVHGVVRARAEILGYADPRAYLFELDRPRASAELQTLIDLITVGKTSFNRYPQHLRAIVETLVPALDAALPECQPIGIWSAGCSTGEEPYGITMALKASGWLSRRRFRILATDINRSSLEHAKRGLYGAPRGPLPETLSRYLHPESGGVRVSDAIRRHVGFERLNLVDDAYPEAGQWHIVVCANVLIYFGRETVVRTVERLVGAMHATGALLLGGSESLSAFDHRAPLRLERLHDSYVYLRGQWSIPTLVPTRPRDAPAESTAHTAADESPTPALDRRSASRTSPSHQVAAALAIARAGDRVTAIERLRPLASGADPDVRRALGLLLLNEHRFQEAHNCLADARDADPLAFDLHFYLGWLDAMEGRLPAAEESLRKALFLEPAFSFARYELGRVLHLRDEFHDAAREYARAVQFAEDPYLRKQLQKRAAGSGETFWFDASFIVELCEANRRRAEIGEPPLVGAFFREGGAHAPGDAHEGCGDG